MRKVFKNLILEFDEQRNGYKILSIKEGTVDLVIPEVADDGRPIVFISSDAFEETYLTLKTIYFSKNLIAFLFTNWSRALFERVESIKVDPDNPIFDSRENCNAIIHTKRNLMLFGCKNTTFPESIVDIMPGATKDFYIKSTFLKRINDVDISRLLNEQSSIDFKEYKSVKLKQYFYTASDCVIDEINILLDKDKPTLDIYAVNGSILDKDKGEHRLIDIPNNEDNLRLLSKLIGLIENALYYDKGESPYGAAAYFEYAAELQKEGKLIKTRNKVLTKEIIAIFNHFYPLDMKWALELVDLTKLERRDFVETVIL